MSPKSSFSVLLMGVALLALLHAAGARSMQRQRQVKVYFYHEPGEYIDLSPVKRMVSARAPARAALAAMLAGPTPAEERAGFYGLIGAGVFHLVKLTINQGTARAEFRSNGKWAGWPGDIAPARFQKAVELTLSQFPNVRRVIVSVDGETDLSSGE